MSKSNRDNMQLCLISAFDQNQLIGCNNQLPWHLPEDLKYFKETTLNHTVVMGRKTFESIGKKLPNRKNIIVSTTLKDTDTIQSPLALFDLGLKGKTFIIGGEKLYTYFLPYAQYLYITHIETTFTGDCYFPHIDWENWRLVHEDIKQPDQETSFKRRYCIYQRLKPHML